MHTLTINGDQFFFPEKWHEIEYRHFRAIVEIGSGRPLVDEMRIMLLLRFTGLQIVQKPIGNDVYLLQHNRRRYRVAVWQLLDICTRLDWLFTLLEGKKDEPPQYTVEYRIIRNLIPVISVPRKLRPPLRLFGPDDGLSNLRFNEYIYAETAHARFCDTGDPAALDALIATLYRPARRKINTSHPDWDGDSRERFNPFLTDKYARSVARVDNVTKLMILTWYRSCGFFLQAEFPEMYMTASAKPGKKVKVFKSFMDMVDELSAADVTKKEAIRESYLYDALGTINGIMRRQNELRQKYPNLYKK